MTRNDAVSALRRFGLGVRPGEIRAVASDPRAFVRAQLSRPASGLAVDDLEPTSATLAAQIEARRVLAEQRKAVPPANPPANSPAPVKPGQVRREAYEADAHARFAGALTTDAPLLERLVWFWSDHFTVSGQKQLVRGIAGAFEREAIRPHVTGRFADMLKAVVGHPAMLIYLDNHLSIGPNSPTGLKRRRGLNENLAREVLELHTLGVDGGYTQFDVGQLARILTGWAVGGMAGATPEDDPRTGAFVFVADRQEPGPHSLLGRIYDVAGPQLASQALDDLARHPSTARHIARKLARHFVGSQVSDALIAKLAERFRMTDGDLAAVTAALLAEEEVWAAPPRTLLPPFDFLVAVGRGYGLTLKPELVIRYTRLLGQPLWHATSPKGWPLGDDAWTAPSGLMQRYRLVERAARECPADPRALATDLLGAALSPETAEAIQRAETRAQGLQLLAMSPEFQRR